MVCHYSHHGLLAINNLYIFNDDIKSFQNGVDTIYNKCKSLGSTPNTKTPNDIINSIQSIYNTAKTDGASIYLGYFDTDYSGSNTYTTTATIPVGYKIVLENVRIRINGLDAVQRCTFITSRTGDHTFTITNTNCTHDQWRFAATTFSAYAIKV